MHAVHLPPRHLWRSAALAALLALAFMVLLSMTAAQLGSDGGSSAPAPERAVPQVVPLAQQPLAPAVSNPFEPLAAPTPLVAASRAD